VRCEVRGAEGVQVKERTENDARGTTHDQCQVRRVETTRIDARLHPYLQ
jgi:hypothetical protein